MNLRRFPYLFLGLASATIALTAVPTPTLGQSDARGLPLSFDGTWQMAEGQNALHNALNAAADSMHVMIREVARLELRRRITPEQVVRLSVANDGGVLLSWDGWGPHRLELDGPPRALRAPRGEQIRADLRFRSGRLVQRHVADDGTRVTTYSLSRDGSAMTMSVRIRSDQLPRDISYRLRYRRR